MIKNENLLHIKTTLSHWLWLPIALWLTLIYCFVNFLLPDALPWDINLYSIQPILWLSLSLAAFIAWRLFESKTEFAFNTLIVAAMIGGVQTAVYFTAALILDSFKFSQYTPDISAALLNVFYAISMTLAIEFSRAYFSIRLKKINLFICLLLISIFFTFLSTPYSGFKQLDNPLFAFPFIGEVLLPRFSEGLLSTYLVMIGGPFPSLAYQGILLIFRWLPPVVPDIPWILSAFLGTMIPLFSLYLLHKQHIKSSSTEITQAQEDNNVTLWIIVMLLAVILLWFNTGMFGISPYVVNGGSMNPLYHTGDIVITKEVPLQSIQVNDIIRFHRGSYDVVHRVMEIQANDNGIYTFITKGDNNNTTDEPVMGHQVAGKVIFKIPLLGWITYAVRKAIMVLFV